MNTYIRIANSTREVIGEPHPIFLCKRGTMQKKLYTYESVTLTQI